MRKLFCTLLVAAAVFVFSSSLFAEEFVNSIRAAQVIGGLKVVSYSGGDNFQRGANTGDWVNCSFKMALNGDITYFEKDGEVLVSENDPPLKGGLPSNAVGETRNFSLWLTALNDQGQEVAFGNFQKDLLLPSEPIEVIRKPNWVQRVVAFAGKGSTLPENAVLKTDSGGTWSYAQYVGGFPIWVDPFKKTPYAIVDVATGLTVVTDIIDPSKGAGSKTDDKSVVNLKWIGAVVEVPEGNYAYLSDQKFDGKDADGIPVKVYIWTLGGNGGSVSAWSNMQAPVQIRILRWMPEGDMPEVASGNEGYASVGNGYDKVVVIMTGVDVIAGFNANFNVSQPTTPVPGGGYGGKG